MPSTNALDKTDLELQKEPPLKVEEVLAAEFNAQHPGRNVQAEYIFAALKGADRSALCLSGGGIRSATFSLGVLQRLSELNLLESFDYLSTVSGGGFIGAWLSCLRRPGSKEPLPPISPSSNANAGGTNVAQEHEAVSHLREFSSYLNPEAGLMSADTWTLGTTFIRNILLNWLMLFPLLMAVLLIPTMLKAAPSVENNFVLGRIFAAGALVFAVLSVAFISKQLPSVCRADGRPGEGQEAFLDRCLLPLFTAALLSALAIWCVQGRWWFPNPYIWAGFGLILHIGGLIAARQRNPLIILAAAAVGAMGGWTVWACFSNRWWHDTSLFATFAIPLLLVLYFVHTVIYSGLVSRLTTDDDREWWSRSGAWILIVSVGWVCVAGIGIYGPGVIDRLDELWAKTLAAAGGISGIATLVLSRSSRTASGRRGAEEPNSKFYEYGLRLAAPLFAMFLLAILAWLADNAVQTVGSIAGKWAITASIVCLATLSLLAGRFVHVNKFSLHAMYRDRLIRAYLGASVPDEDRKAHPFTGFDPADNISMADLERRRPMHIVNIALNLVGGDNLAWQQRKAESFTVSPLHLGSRNLGYRRTRVYSDPEKNISLGTAVAISGAAASPNMGYHSSPIVTFLMTLFNARLGWWLGNPGEAGAHTWYKSGPSHALKPLLAELFGLTNNRAEYINVSDGGHFENLGLYEMVLRRCKRIVVVDGSCDTDYCYDDLGNAVRKIQVDFGVSIDFGTGLGFRRYADLKLTLEKAPRTAAFHYAVGTIHYSNSEKGTLLYIKPVLTGDESADVLHYASTDPRFPHQPTSDQSFDEAQFESYRALGYHSVLSFTRSEPGSIPALFDAAAVALPAKEETPALAAAASASLTRLETALDAAPHRD